MTPLFPSYRDVQRLEFKIDAIARQVGVVIKHEDFLIHMEQNLMTTAADIQAQSADLINKVNAETSAIAAIQTLVQGQQASIADLTQQLKDAIANGADQATLQAIADNLTTANTAIDANVAAEAAIANTTSAPAPVPPVAVSPTAPAGVPVIVGISPSLGNELGGDTISLNGTGLGGVTAVTFGGVASPSVAPDHDGALSVVTPAGTGTVDVVVTTPAGDSNAVQFAYAAAPAAPTT
jgi:hypothetical protein